MHAGVLQNRLFFSRFTSLQGPFQDGFFLHGNHLRDTLPMVASSTLSFTKHTFTSLCQTSAQKPFAAYDAYNAYDGYDAYDAYNAYNTYDAYDAYNAYNTYNAYYVLKSHNYRMLAVSGTLYRLYANILR